MHVSRIWDPCYVWALGPLLLHHLLQQPEWMWLNLVLNCLPSADGFSNLGSSLHPWYPWHLLGIAPNKTWSISRGRPRALWTASNISCSPLGQPILASAGFGKTWQSYTSSGGWNIQKNLSTSQRHQHISTQYSWLRPDFSCVINSNTSTARWDAASRPESTRSICWRRWWRRSSPPALLHRFGSWVWVRNWGSKGTPDLGCLDNSESTSQDHAKKQHLEQRGC